MSPNELLAALLHDSTAEEAVKKLIERIRAGQVDLNSIGSEIGQLVAVLKQWFAANPATAFAILRQVQPILALPNLVIVTRYDDVCDVLTRHRDYSVTYGPRMQAMTGGGNFFLGMQESPEYERDTSLMRLAMPSHEAATKVNDFVTATAKRLVGDAGGKIDLVQQLTRVVPARWIANYFGFLPTDEQQFIDDCHAVFRYLFIGPPGDEQVQREADVAASRLREAIDRAIEQRQANPAAPPRDDVLARCLQQQQAGLPGADNVQIRNNLFGLFVGAVPTTSEATTNALLQLLARPDELAKAQEAARRDDFPLLQRYVIEALRFQPINPFLVRVAAHDDVLAKGTSRETRIRQGTVVLAATQSAMFDESVVDDPQAFRIDRPDHHYILYGVGMHACFGRYVNDVQIPRIAQALLVKHDLRLPPGDAGRLKHKGPFPWSVTVEYKP
ncbi:MAG: cytochrome P450 [Planctomycetales bacterium]|nr:cytochrome P450 [Planctomycetales bacterium]